MSFQPTLTRFVFTDLKGEALLWLSLLVGLTKFNYNSSMFKFCRSRSILIISFMFKFSLSRSHSRLQVIAASWRQDKWNWNFTFFSISPLPCYWAVRQGKLGLIVRRNDSFPGVKLKKQVLFPPWIPIWSNNLINIFC